MIFYRLLDYAYCCIVIVLMTFLICTSTPIGVYYDIS